MSRVLFATTPSKEDDWGFWPPLGLLYLASVLKENGHKVKIIDAWAAHMSKKQLLKEIKKFQPDIMGMGCIYDTLLRNMEIMKKVSEILPNTTLITGQIVPTFTSNELMKKFDFIDSVIRGEGEKTILELTNSIENNKDLSKIRGICYRKNNRIIQNPPHGFIKDLDSIPFPDRKLLGKTRYRLDFGSIKLSFDKFTSVLTSRGCPFKCTYCACSAFWGYKWRVRSVDNVLDELELLYSEGYKEIMFVDDNFTLIPKRVNKICEGIRKRGLDFTWYCEGRADSSSIEMFRKMRSAGCTTIFIGIESGSQRVLDYYNKRTTPEMITNALKNAKKVGLNVMGSIIIGNPIETDKDIKETSRLIKELPLDALEANVLSITPGTLIWDQIKKEGRLKKDDWVKEHRSYYFYPSVSKQRLNEFLNKEYRYFYVRPSYIKNLFSNIFSNSTKRKVVLGNIFNPDLYMSMLGLKKHRFLEDYVGT